jgi:hypothetical protein
MYNMYDRFLAIRSETIVIEAQKEVLCSKAPVSLQNGRRRRNRRRPATGQYNKEEDSFDSGREATGCITTYDSVKLAIVWVALQKKR